MDTNDKVKTTDEVKARMAEVEVEARTTDYDDDRQGQDPSWIAGTYRGYLDALEWALGRGGERAEGRRAKKEAAATSTVNPFSKPIEEWTETELAEDERTCQGIPARVHYDAYMADKKARTYRIPTKLGEKLWLLAEGPPLKNLRVDFHGWKKGTLSDKGFLVAVEEYLTIQGRIQETFASDELLGAWYNCTGEAVEWTEPPAKPEDDFPF